MNLLFFDCESTGRPLKKKRDNIPMTVLENWPRVIQLSWEIVNEAGEVLVARDYLIKPDGWLVPKEEFWLTHGFSTEKCEECGIPLPMVLALFVADIWEHDIKTIIAHNIYFDYNTLGAEMIRYNVRTGRVMTQICTMLSAVNVTRIPFGRDRRPWKNKTWKAPGLQVLFKHLFGKEFEGAHDSRVDVVACRMCFFKLHAMGVIIL